MEITRLSLLSRSYFLLRCDHKKSPDGVGGPSEGMLMKFTFLLTLKKTQKHSEDWRSSQTLSMARKISGTSVVDTNLIFRTNKEILQKLSPATMTSSTNTSHFHLHSAGDREILCKFFAISLTLACESPAKLTRKTFFTAFCRARRRCVCVICMRASPS